MNHYQKDGSMEDAKRNKEAIGVLINDPHLNKDNGDLVKDIFYQLIEVCRKYKTNRIFCGGDIFTNRSGQPLTCLIDFKEIIERVKQAGIEMHVIPGNHDKTDGNSEKSYLEVYESDYFNLYRVGSRKFFSGVVVAFIPYFGDDRWLSEFEKVTEQIEENFNDGDIDEDTPLILITHSGFDGVVNNDGSRVSSEIKPKLFEDWTKVLIGHYHNASKLADNVIYTGSAYQNNFGESFDDKGFTVIFDDGSTKFVRSKFPRYIKETLDVDDTDALLGLLEAYKDNKTDHIRFVFKGKKSDAHKVNMTEIQNKYGIDCQYEAEEQVEAMEACENPEVLNHSSRTIRQDFIKFCSENGIKGNKFKYGLELIKEIS